MHDKYTAELWTFDPVVDPPCMEKYDQFGQWIFIYRNPQKDRINVHHNSIFKETLSIDPGVNVFGTGHINGTGDIVYIAPGLCGQIGQQHRIISKLQKDRDNEVNEDADVIEARRSKELAQKAFYRKVVARMQASRRVYIQCV
jgi:hypothetical protein